MRQAILALAAAATVAAPAAGALSPTAYRRELRSACVDFHTRSAPVTKRLAAARTRPATLAALRAVVPLAQELVARVARLEPPAGLASLHRRGASVLAQQLTLLRRIVLRVEHGETARAALGGLVGAAAVRLARERQTTFTRLGVPVCGA